MKNKTKPNNDEDITQFQLALLATILATANPDLTPREAVALAWEFLLAAAKSLEEDNETK